MKKYLFAIAFVAFYLNPANSQAVDPVESNIQNVQKTDLSNVDEKISTSNSEPTPKIVLPKIPNSIAIGDIHFRKQFYDSLIAEGIKNGEKNKVTFIKKYLSVQEVKGFNEAIIQSITKAGYVPLFVDGLDFSDNENIDGRLINRIQRGDFNNSKFVLVGNIVDVGSSNSNEFIQGTSNFSFKSEYSLTVNFVMIDAESLQTVADFNVTGSSKSIYIGNSNSRPPQNSSKLLNDLIKDFNIDAQRKFLDHLPPINKDGIIDKIFSDKKEIGVGDPSTLKIYKSNQKKSQIKSKDDSDEVIIYKK
jgi:hypothetical protein